jgi:signal transduction histidine kinase
MTDSPASSRRTELVWLAPAALVVVGTLGSNHGAGSATATVVGSGVLAAMAGLAVLLATVRPRMAVLVNAVAVATYFATGMVDGPIFLTCPLVALVAAQRTRPRPLLWVVGPAVGLVVAGLVVRVAAHDGSGFETFWQALGVCALALAACAGGWWLQDRREVRAEQARHTATEERLRMARDLHDGVGHGLAVIAMQAGVALHLLEKEDRPGVQPVRASLKAIRDTSRESLAALRAELAEMSGQPAARRPALGLADLPALVGRVRAGGLDVEVRGDAGDVPDTVGQVVYAVLQEALTNVLRHADADRAVVTLQRGADGLTLTVEDDGAGTLGTRVPGMGITGMRARVERLGGSLDAGPSAGGFVVRALVPAAATEWPV